MRRFCVIAVLATALSAPLLAQQALPPATQAPQGGQPTQAPPPAARGQQTGQRGGRASQQPTPPPSQPGGQRGGSGWQTPSQNIRIEVAITDSAEKTTKKVVSMLVADGNDGRIRSANGQGVLNVDGYGQATSDGRVFVFVTIEYMPDRSANVTNLNQSIRLVLAAGKPTLISQSADPGTDRKVTVEVTATVVK